MARNIATMKDDIVVDQSPLIQQYLPPKPTAASSSTITPASAMEETEYEQPDNPTAKLNRKQILLQQNIEFRKKFETMALHWQEVLCDTVSEQVLGEAANRIKRTHYQEIIEERNIGKLCGYPLCPKPPRDIKGKFRISLQERKVFDISVLKQFCSSTCLAASRWLESQMTEEPLYLVNSDPEYLKETRVSIVPLDMELAEFQAKRASTSSSSTSHQHQGQQQQQQQQHRKPSVSSLSSTNAASGSLSEAYVQSILATVPETPAFIKIVEKSSEDVDQDMDQDMEEEQHNFGGQDVTQEAKDDQQYDIIEGFKVPVPNSSSSRSQLRPPGVSKNTQEAKAIADQLAKVTLSDSQPGSLSSSSHQQQPQQTQEQAETALARSLSSMSMDTQPDIFLRTNTPIFIAASTRHYAATAPFTIRHWTTSTDDIIVEGIITYNQAMQDNAAEILKGVQVMLFDSVSGTDSSTTKLIIRIDGGE
ncbi:RNA polymerase II associated protein 2 [Gryganskiella cystojenkinii]|nr:RNA polymerase II associated protein 2 [Gryganskiella cystojenkinii]